MPKMSKMTVSFLYQKLYQKKRKNDKNQHAIHYIENDFRKHLESTTKQQDGAAMSRTLAIVPKQWVL